MVHTVDFTLGDAAITLETGRLARRADGAVVARHGKSFVLATVVVGADRPDVDFLPLRVDYQEKMAAAARIPGNFFRRETRAGEGEILVARRIDRALRPLVARGFRAEVQVTVTVYSADEGSDLEGLGLLAAGAALHLSAVPFDGPVAGATLAARGDALTVFTAPTKGADVELVLAATAEGVVMLGGRAGEVSEARLVEVLEQAQAGLAPALEAMDRLRAAAGQPKRGVSAGEVDWAGVLDAHLPAIEAALDERQRPAREVARRAAKAEAVGAGASEAAFDAAWKRTLRARTLAGRRADGRAADAVRPLDCETGLLGAAHGSALFTRGGTAALASVTLGDTRQGQDVETLFGMSRQHFLLHYNFPGFAVGESFPPRSPGRRELGHGRLARRALAGQMPGRKAYPYTVRVDVDITDSDGSSSMATVCAATLALRQAGVPLSAPVAGVAMGLVRGSEGHVVLTDITGEEDFCGDMDFKVAGTAAGVTAVQLDNKLGSLPVALLVEALEAAKAARAHILEAMGPALTTLDETPADHVPQQERVRINTHRIGQLIGAGGRNLNAIQKRTGAKIDVAQDGWVTVMGKDADSLAAAVREVRAVSLELEKDGLYLGEVVGIQEYGVFVRFAEHEGLVHVSELAEQRVDDPRSVTKEGEEMLVRVIGTDSRGRLKLSKKAAAGADKGAALNA